MAFLEFLVRYYRLSIPRDEELFQHEEKLVKLKVCETAFVLVDVWDTNKRRLLPEQFFWSGNNFLNRVKLITENRIKPAVDAARRVGLPIIHVPTYYVAIKYSKYRELDKMPKITYKEPSKQPRPEWPSPDFVEKKRSEFLEERCGLDLDEFNKGEELKRSATYISEAVKPHPEDLIVETGEQFHRILHDMKILNLIYVGFATNLCLLDKPGALREMAKRGYNLILLRDCTAATEIDWTISRGWLMTKLFIDLIEMRLAYTTTSDMFIKACENAFKT